MKETLIIIVGICLCSVGAYGFMNGVDYWGWWLFCGLCTVLATLPEY